MNLLWGLSCLLVWISYDIQAGIKIAVSLMKIKHKQTVWLTQRKHAFKLNVSQCHREGLSHFIETQTANCHKSCTASVHEHACKHKAEEREGML